MHNIHGRETGALRNGTATLTALASCVLLFACGNLTAGGGTATASLTVSGDAFDGIAALQSVVGLDLAPPSRMSSETPDGEVRADFFIFLETADGSSTSLSEDQIQVRLDVQGRQEVDAVDSMVIPAAHYTQIRIVFTDIRVDVKDGLFIDGDTVLGEVRVELKDTALAVTRPLNVDIRDGESVFLLMDLNANTWLQAVDPLLRVIDEAAFGDAVSVAVQ